MKFFAAVKSADFAAKAFAAAGINFESSLAAGDVNALKAHLDSATAAAVTAAAKPDAELTAKVATLTEQIATIDSELESAAAVNSVLTETITAIGVTLPKHAADATAEAQVAANKLALEGHIKTRAQGILAQTGHPALTESPAAGIAAKTMTRAAFNSLSAYDQSEFGKSGGILTE